MGYKIFKNWKVWKMLTKSFSPLSINNQNKTKEALIKELQELQKENNFLKTSHNKGIIEHKQSDDELHNSEINYKKLIDGMNETVWVIDFNGKLIDVNNSAIEVLGYSKEELLTLGLYGIDTSLKKEDIIALANAMQSDKVQIFETSHKTKDGKTFPVEVRSSLVTYHGKPAILSIVRDITAHKQAEVALRESEEKFRKIIETSPDGIAITTLDGTIQFVTAKVISMWGHTLADEIIGRNTMEFVHPSYHEKAILLVNEMINGKLTGASDYLMVRKDGSHFYAEANANILCDANNKPIGILYVQRDITHRKQAEIALQESEHKLRTLFNAMKDVVFEMDYDGKYIYIAPTSVDLMVKPPKEVVGKTLYELFPKNIADKFLEFVRKCLDENKMKTIEYPMLINDKTIWFEGRAVPKTKNSVLYIASDITERKLAKDALQESQRRLTTLIGNLLGIAYRCKNDSDWTMEFISDGCHSLTGYLSEEFVGNKRLSYNKIVHPDDRQMVWNIIQDALKKKKAYQLSYRIITASGEEKWVLEQGHGIFVEKEKLVALEGYIANITELKQSEEALLQSYAFNESLVTTIPFGMHIVDETGTILFQSERFKEIFNENGIGIKCWELCRDDKKQCSSCPLIKGITVGKTEAYEASGILGDNIFEINHTGMMYDGKKAMLEIFIDITERKRGEQELIIAKEHAEESDRLKSAFLANISHEIRTPMNGILGFAELLKKPNLSGEDQQEYIKIIEIAGARMLNIISNIVSISTIESGLMNVEMEEVNINEQFKFIYTFFTHEVESKGMKLSYKNYLPAKETNITTDREKLFAILVNIVKNAIKYTSEGYIEIGCDIVAMESAPMLQIYVKDTGIGIAKDRREAIFERFIQAEIEDKMAHQGAGLGLSISKAYIEMLGGKIWVEGEEGVGSTFYFSLPYHAEIAAEIVIENDSSFDEADENIGPELHELKILIAEDDEVSKMLISINVKTFGKEILKVSTGGEAVEACRNNPDIDLILMDIKMPEMGGYEATRQIRKFNSKVIIIAQTAYGHDGERKNALKAGCNDYISKPIKETELLALIGQHFSK